ncbi:MAG: Holliday junction resolvase [Thermoplasmata archaeon]
MNGAVYERELKTLLERSFLVVRAGGSLGVDLVALNRLCSVAIEVKASSKPVINFTSACSRAQKQALELLDACQRNGVLLLYAYRLKHASKTDSWRVFKMPVNSLRGYAKLIATHIPDVACTPSQNYVMRWENGMPLHAFLQFFAPIGKVDSSLDYPRI